MDAVGCIQNRVCTSGTNLNLCSSCFPIEIYPFFFFCSHLQSIPADPWYLPGSLLHAATPTQGAQSWPEQPFGPLGRAQPRGLEPSAVLSGVQHGAKKYPKKTLSRHLILSNSSVSPDQIGSIPSHKPLQVCFGQEVRNDGFIPDVF